MDTDEDVDDDDDDDDDNSATFTSCDNDAFVFTADKGSFISRLDGRPTCVLILQTSARCSGADTRRPYSLLYDAYARACLYRHTLQEAQLSSRDRATPRVFGDSLSPAELLLPMQEVW